MNKKTFVFLVLLSFVSTLTIAQDEADIYWGKFNPLEKGTSIYLLGNRGDAILGYKRAGKNISIIKYSLSDLQVNEETPIIGKSTEGKGSVISKDYSFDHIVMLKNKNYVCVTQFDKKTKENTLYMEEFNNSGHLTGGLKKIVEMPARSKRSSRGFDVIVSKDSTKFLLVNIPSYDKYSGQKFGFEVYDEDLNVLNNAEVSLPNNFKYFLVDENEITLSNDGIVYMLAEITEQKSDKVKGEAGYYYEMLAINPNGTGDVTTYDLKLPQKAITDISYSLEEGKYIVCAGFYGNIKGNSTSSTGQIDGIFYFRIDKDSKAIENIGTKVLDRDFVADLTTERNSNKGKGIPNKFNLLDFTKRSDGGAVLVSEYQDFYETVSTTSGPNGTTTTVTDHYIRNNIIVVNINPDGSIKWYANIPKKQQTIDDGAAYSSFLMVTRGDKMYFVYNDNPDNVGPKASPDPKDIKRMTSSKKSMAVLVELSESGQFTKSALFSNKENKVTITPSKSAKINDNEYIIPALDNKSKTCCFLPAAPKKYKLARIEFK
jgi:hypothetical protein